MKRNKMLSSMELIDEKYVDEANPNKKRKNRLARLGAIAAAAAIMITSLSMWLFIPYDQNPPDVSSYKNSQYYPLIQKLNELTFKKPTHNNRFELFSSAFGAKEDAAEDIAKSPTSSSPNYVETTDNQVSGVIEADLIKRSDRHIFYLRGNVLSVYPINGLDTEAIATFTVTTGDPQVYCYGVEMYLSDDCSTLTVVLPCYSGRKHQTQIVSLDVSDPSNIAEKERVSVSGTYVSSRLTEGKLLLVTNFSVVGAPDFSDESAFIPEVRTRDDIIRPAMKDIICPDNADSSSYAVVTMLNPRSMELVGSVACLSYSHELYASSDSLYLTRSYSDRLETDTTATVTSMSEITRVSYSDVGLEIKGTVRIKGTIKDQYSLDEHEGVLRVAVTTRSNVFSVTRDEKLRVDSFIIKSGKTNASLYCLDKETLETLAAVESFAPEGEQLQSSRFDGDTAYICTSIQLSDPVFFFDLSDLNNITYKDTGTIEGFSSSLINFGDGYLLGIGVGGSWSTVKIEVYRETATGVASVCSKEIPGANYSNRYKSYFIDRERSLIGLMISPHVAGGSSGVNSDYYLLLHFDGARLVPVMEEKLSGNYDSARAVLIDGCFYMFTDATFKVKAMN